MLDTSSGETTISTITDRVLVVDLTHEDIPVIDLCDDVKIPVVDLSDDDDDISNEDVTSNYTRPDWVLKEWEPRDFDSPMSPTYRCDRGLPGPSSPAASKFLQEWDHTYSYDRGMAGPSTSAASNLDPSSPGSPMWSPMSPENARDRGMACNSPTYSYDRGMAGPSTPAASNLAPISPGSPMWSPMSPENALSSPGDSSVRSIEVGSPFYSIGSPLYIPGSPSSSSSHSDVYSGYGGMRRED